MHFVAARAIRCDATPRVVRILQRDLHSAQQLVGRAAVIRMHAHRGRDVQIERGAGEMKAGTYHAGELIGIQDRALDGAILGDHEELTLGDAHHDVGRAGVLPHAPRSFPHHVITDVMSERAVDFAHVARVDQNQRAASHRAWRCGSAPPGVAPRMRGSAVRLPSHGRHGA